ncbi:hypothetical protein F4827_003916 [Paraburkholderia bannensis]|uniref:Uncharacterized protein n=1 Tax=Paraburkholderia bannensis TaxID=765414 RepID=A0A7W9TZ41_9BURK|nr:MULTISPECIES: hypothetical protein [Paraburkholderia]MBB3259042.1 hypothetical protein [Paraburkholderia sp. WP4_3_2]MBB6104057.1 hypothetical protein [Paraburkholderia bannensis]
MKSPKTLLLIALLLPAIDYAQASQTYYFGEGQSTPQSHHASKPTRKQAHRRHTSRHSPHPDQYSHS